jgi:hypothetical protein
MQIYPSHFFEDQRYRIDPKLCFVIMPFVEPWSKRTFLMLKEVIEDVGFKCTTAEDFQGRLVLKDIWSKINEAAFIVADLTSNNPNVFYELGIAHTLGKEVIPILQNGHQIPFDQRPFRILFYEDNYDGFVKLRNELPKWIKDITFYRTPQTIIKNELVDVFNSWRQTHKSPRFIGDAFNDLNLAGINFSDIALTETLLTKTDLSNSRLCNSILIRCNLVRAILRNADLNSANLSEADLEMCDLSGAVLTNTIVLRANFRQTILFCADVKGLTIDYSTFRKYGSVFDDAKNKNDIIIEK